MLSIQANSYNLMAVTFTPIRNQNTEVYPSSYLKLLLQQLQGKNYIVSNKNIIGKKLNKCIRLNEEDKEGTLIFQITNTSRNSIF